MVESSRPEAEIRQELSTFGNEVVKLLAPVIGKPDFPLRVIKLAHFMRDKHRLHRRQWEDLALWGRQLAPGDPKCRAFSDWAREQRVPEWLFTMPYDEARTQAYQRGLEHLVQPGMVVLEIGSGCGLLAMMAARAGAGHVYSCEQEPTLAGIAQDIIRHNDYADRITIIPKKSFDLQIGTDLPEKADLLFNELADVHLLGYGVLAIIEDARRRLLQPQATIVPERIAALGMLVGGPAWRHQCRVDKVSGFDLSPLNHFSPTEVTVFSDADLGEAFSDPFPLFSFDFAQEDHFPAASRQLEVSATREGQVEGLLQWLRLDFHEGISFENRPPVKSPSRPRFRVFPKPITVHPGDRISLRLEHDRQHIFVQPVVDR
jgi:protein arginine N-methyltransferase 7